MTGIVDVVSSGSCSGCGACAAASPEINMAVTENQTFLPIISGVGEAALSKGTSVCPFADETPDEDEVARQIFDPAMPTDDRVGRFLGTYAGRIEDIDEIVKSSSGGMTTWVLTQLMERGDVDGVIHVGPSAVEDELFSYVVSHSVEEMRVRRKSQYFPVNFASALSEIHGDGKKYAFVGIPCAVKAVRHLTAQDPVLAEQLVVVVGIVCGHLKSMAYAESFAWQLGVEPRDLAGVDFRIKDPERTSREYGFKAVSTTGESQEAKTLTLVGGSWGHAVFQLPACDYCDDIFAETADVVLGDAWLAKYEIAWQGTNVVLTRNDLIDELLRDGRDRGELMLDDLSVDGVAATQAGNFRHRRDGLAVRLADDIRDGKWVPRKRVKPDLEAVDVERRRLIRQRREISRQSHGFFARARLENDLGVYLRGITPLISDYQALTKMTFGTRVRNKLKREGWKLLAKVRKVRSA